MIRDLERAQSSVIYLICVLYYKLSISSYLLEPRAAALSLCYPASLNSNT